MNVRLAAARPAHLFWMGGLGAIAPIFLSLLTLDVSTVFATTSPLVVLGYLVRASLLFLAGGLYVWIYHADEKVRSRIFEFGVLAPALLTTAVNGLQVPKPSSTGAAGPVVHPAVILVGEAFADQGDVPVRMFAGPQFSASQQFWYGLTGQRETRRSYVIAGSYRSEAEARAAAQAARRRWPQFGVSVYKPYGAQRRYTVVLGDALTYAGAIKLRDQARAAGLRGCSVWTP